MEKESIICKTIETKKNKVEAHFNRFLNNISEEGLKRKNHDIAEVLRKDGREKRFAEKRFAEKREMPELNIELLPNMNIDDLSECAKLIDSPILQQVHLGVLGIRKMVSNYNKSPIKKIINSGVVPKLIDLIDKEKCSPNIKYEAAWCITNLAMGNFDQVKYLTDNGVIPKLLKLMQSEQDYLKDQAIWAIGNIVCENIMFRDMALNEGVLESLIKILEVTSDANVIKEGCWVISNMVKGTPPPPFEKVKNVRFRVSV